MRIPAIAVASGFSCERLPCPCKIMVPHCAERSLFRTSSYFERETGYWRELPPVCG